MRYERTYHEWGAIRPIRVLNGTFWVLRFGAPWRDLPQEFGPYTTCYDRFIRRRRAGVAGR
jgi:transposase